MAFVKVNKSRMGTRPDENPNIRMGWHKQGETARGLYFGITRILVEEVGWRLVEQTPKDGSDQVRVACIIDVMEGIHEDAGFFMLTESETGYRLGTNKGSSSSASLSMNVALNRLRHYVINDAEIEVEPHSVEFTIDSKDKTVLIQCPDWLRYNPLSVPDKEPEPPPPPQVEEVKTKEGPPTVRQRAMRATNEVAAEVADVIPLNRRERRRIASTVARTLSK